MRTEVRRRSAHSMARSPWIAGPRESQSSVLPLLDGGDDRVHVRRVASQSESHSQWGRTWTASAPGAWVTVAQSYLVPSGIEDRHVSRMRDNGVVREGLEVVGVCSR